MNHQSPQQSKPFICVNHGTGKIDLRHHLSMLISDINPMKPIQLHLKEDGDLNNQPSMCIVLQDVNNTIAYGEISVRMLNEGLQDIGYKLVKLDQVKEENKLPDIFK